jgi:hypothetical protein
MTWILAIYMSIPGDHPKLMGWSEYSNKAACVYAGNHLRPLPKPETWRCLEQ